MPYKLGTTDTQVQIQCSKNLPVMVYRARQVSGHASNASYIREAIIQAIARDLGVSAEELLAEQPKPYVNYPIIEEVR